MRDLSTLSAVIQEQLRRYHLEKGVKQQQSLSLWERVAGPTVAAVTQASDVRDGILFVYTRSSAWSQELALMREPLIQRMNVELGSEVVKDIRFQVKRFRKAAAEKAPAPNPLRDLTEAERAALAALASDLDPNVAGHIRSLAEKQMRGQRADRSCSICGGPVHRNESICPYCQGDA
ncbi:MAG TPA: DUF721 domain-containing protein [Armatimonadota bacterium]